MPPRKRYEQERYFNFHEKNTGANRERLRQGIYGGDGPFCNVRNPRGGRRGRDPFDDDDTRRPPPNRPPPRRGHDWRTRDDSPPHGAPREGFGGASARREGHGPAAHWDNRGPVGGDPYGNPHRNNRDPDVPKSESVLPHEEKKDDDRYGSYGYPQRGHGYKRPSSFLRNSQAQEDGFRIDRSGRNHNRNAAAAAPAANAEVDDWGPRRKRKKNVHLGEIKKRNRQDEIETNKLYCTVCDIFLRVPEERAAHDNSDKHQMALDSYRNSMATATTAPINKGNTELSNPLTNASHPIEHLSTHDEIDQTMREGMAKFSQTEISGSFKQWVERSIAAAKDRGEAMGDPMVIKCVKKEVMYEFVRHSQGSSLQRIDWDRVPLATGIGFTEVAMVGAAIRTFSDTEIAALEQERKAVEALKAQVVQQEMIIDAEMHDASSSIPPSMAADSVASGLDQSRDEFEDPFLFASVVTGRAPPKDVAPGPEKQLFVAKPARDRLGDRASRMLSGAMFIAMDLIAENHCKRTKKQPVNDKKEDVKPLLEKYDVSKNEFDSSEYDFESLWSQLDSIVYGLTAAASRLHVVRGCLEMQVHMAIDARKFSKAAGPASQLVRMFKDHGCDKGGRAEEFILYWIISWWFTESDKLTAEEPAVSPSLKLASSLREMPKGVVDNLFVDEAMGVARAMLSNNWVCFFRYFNKSLVHSSTRSRSRGIALPLVDFVRERALMTILHVSVVGQSKTYDGPPKVPLGKVMDVLGYNTEVNEDGVDEELVAVREFIRDLPQDIEVPSDRGGEGRDVALGVHDTIASVQLRDVVNVPLIVQQTGHTMRIIKPKTEADIEVC